MLSNYFFDEKTVPEALLERLSQSYDPDQKERILAGYAAQRTVSFRINVLKTTVPAVLEQMQAANIALSSVPWSDTAFFCKDTTVTELTLRALPCYEKGEIYLQNLSSMLPPVILQPKQGTEILDMTAAPGGKTTQIAAMTQNRANIMACERHRARAEKLKYNLQKQGARRVSLTIKDARQLDPFFSFDQILLDAPCSGSGTVSLRTGLGLQTFTPLLLQKTTRLQKALLNKAVSLLKEGHTMVYSTCSIVPEENEAQIQSLLETKAVQLEPISFSGMETLPLLPTKLEGTLCVCPNVQYEGFFVAKLKKNS